MSIRILAIETSCDETSVAVVLDGIKILANVVSSQAALHEKFGGVVPEIASRKHLEVINPAIQEALIKAGLRFSDLNAVAVTYGPGLVGALLVGISAAKAVAYALDIPLIAVNHLEGHIYANFLVEPALSFPLVCLVVSGGHTDLIYVSGHGCYRVLGRTRDDAAGETFDKIARVLGLGYPGGPLIEQSAWGGNPETVSFPRAYLEEGSLDFSFSGLKTSVINYLRRQEQEIEKVSLCDLAASFQKAVVDVLVEKTIKAARACGCLTILLAGGVAANSVLREELAEKAKGEKMRLICPPLELCTDNAAMIGCAAYYKYLQADFAPLALNAVATLKLGEKQY